MFVVRLDAAAAQVVVGPREALEARAVELRDVNWIGEGGMSDLPPGGLDIVARVRSTRPPAPARLLAGEGGRATVVFASGEFGVSPGQACVFYDGEGFEARVLGGGFIAAVEPSILVQKPVEGAIAARLA